MSAYKFGDRVEVRDKDTDKWQKARFIRYAETRGPRYRVFDEKRNTILKFYQCRKDSANQ